MGAIAIGFGSEGLGVSKGLGLSLLHFLQVATVRGSRVSSC